ncbi:MAG: PASTA domain-containing protein [Burkholderiales bacterium]|nr:PASTA domain-containing protein [Burkholderiales bacterium]
MAAAPVPPRGSVVTFYSYKGGTGRTMALANTACVLAELERGNRDAVLVVDWDLEAPGLHRFLPPRLRARDAAIDLGLDDQPGLIDLALELVAALPADAPETEARAAMRAASAIDAIDLDRFVAPTEVAGVSILRAGRNDDGRYAARVGTFDWEALFRRAPAIYRALAGRLAARFRWVLVDSRTGVTDISGICTSLLPEKLVVVFTPNRQSLSGVRELVQRAVAYRAASDDLRPLLVYPLPSRIEASLERLSRHWRYGNPDAGIVGYQPMFKELLAGCYGLEDCDLQDYFDAVQIQQTPDAAYGELIAVRDGSADRLSLASSYRVFVERLTSGRAPWESKDVVQPAAAPARKQSPPAVDFDPFETEAPAAAAVPAMPRTVPDSTIAGDGEAAADPFAEVGEDTVTRPPPRAATMAPAAPPAGPTVFASFARADAAKVAPLMRVLEGEGFRVRSGADSLAGSESYTTQVTRILDASDVVVVFWSRASVESRLVEAEVLEGMRRGVLVPVLLDEALPPLGLRHILAVDLSRGDARGVEQLVDAVRRISSRKPGDAIVPPGHEEDPMRTLPPAPRAGERPAASAGPVREAPAGAAPRGVNRAFAATVAVGALMLAVLAAVALRPRPQGSPPGSDPVASTSPPPPAIAKVTVPEVIDLASEVAEAAVKAAGLGVVLKDAESGVESKTLDGIVIGQFPDARSDAPAGSVVQLIVATNTVQVPLLVGVTLSDALARLRGSGLELGRVESVATSQAPSGTVVAQDPPLGQRVAAGARVDVGVAGAPARSLPSSAPK